MKIVAMIKTKLMSSRSEWLDTFPSMPTAFQETLTTNGLCSVVGEDYIDLSEKKNSLENLNRPVRGECFAQQNVSNHSNGGVQVFHYRFLKTLALIYIFTSSLIAADRFDKMLDRLAFEAQDPQERLDGYKRLIVYSEQQGLSVPQVERFMAALESTYKARDVAARQVLVGIQDVLLKALRVPEFKEYRDRLTGYLTTLQYDLRPFAIKSGDFVTLEACGRKMFCTTEHNNSGFLIRGAAPLLEKQVRVDSLFKIVAGAENEVIKSGDVVRLEPVYVRYGSYVLPPPGVVAGLALPAPDRHGAGGEAIVHNEQSKLVVVAPEAAELTGAPIVQEQPICFSVLGSGLVWSCPAQGDANLFSQPAAEAETAGQHLFALRTVKPAGVERAHQKLIKANIDIALKEKTFEERVAGVTKIFSSIRTGLTPEDVTVLRGTANNLFALSNAASGSGLRLMQKLFDVAAVHPAFGVDKLTFEQSASSVRDTLNARAISFGNVVSLTKLDHQGAVQTTMSDDLTKLGHLKITIGRRHGSRLMGQQCTLLESPVGKQGPLAFGDEVIVKSFFVDDGRDGGLLACPVTWWVNSIEQNGVKSLQVLASSSKAVQTHNGQEIFIIKPPSGLAGQGAVLPGDAVQLVGKQSGVVLALGGSSGDKPGDTTFEVRRFSKEKLVALADKRFKQYVQRLEGEVDLSKKTIMLEAALDLFKGQKLLSTQSGKILYASLKRVAEGPQIPGAVVPGLQSVLVKAQDAPFSPGAKKRFTAWGQKLLAKNPASISTSRVL
jgi:hypothetical protein